MTKPPELIEFEKKICKITKESVKDVNSSTRNKDTVLARWMIWYLANDILKISLADIGRMYNRDHTSVMRGINKLKKSTDQKCKVILDEFFAVKE